VIFFGLHNRPMEKTIRSIMYQFEESGSVQTYGHLCVLIQLKTFIFWKWWSNAYSKQRNTW